MILGGIRGLNIEKVFEGGFIFFGDERLKSTILKSGIPVIVDDFAFELGSLFSRL